LGTEKGQFEQSFCNENDSPFQVQGDTKKRERLKNPTKIEEIQEEKNI